MTFLTTRISADIDNELSLFLSAYAKKHNINREDAIIIAISLMKEKEEEK